MIIDKNLEMSNKQTLAISVGNVASSDVIDLVKAGIGRGTPVKVLCQITTDLDSEADNTTLLVKLQTCAAEDFGSNVVDLVTTAALAQTVCVAGYKPIECYLPENTLQYLRMYYTIGVADCSAGNIEAGLIIDNQSNKQSVWA